jgi:hypothetical protein
MTIDRVVTNLYTCCKCKYRWTRWSGNGNVHDDQSAETIPIPSPGPGLESLIDTLVGGQSITVITDTNATELYSNPDLLFNSKVDITGQIFNFPPSGVTGTRALQMYQAGNNDRNTIVTYSISSPPQLSEDDSVRVVGNNGGSIEFSNMFGATIEGVLVNADLVEKVDCASIINPASKVITVEQTQEDNGIIVTLHRVEFSDENTRVYLTVENTDPTEEVNFYTFNAKAIQGRTQFGTTYSFDVDYPEIDSDIPPGIRENGVVIFEPLDPTASQTEFRFEANKGFTEDSEFVFNVRINGEGISQERDGRDGEEERG